MKSFRGAAGERAAVLKILAGAVLISFSGVYVKLAHVGPTVSGFYRVFFGGLFLLALVLARGERVWGGVRHLGACIACGLVFFLDLYSWHKSILYIGPGLATIIGNFQVFFLGLTGVLVFKEKMNIKLAVSIPIAVAGLFMVVGMEWAGLGDGYKTGLFLGLSTAFFYTLYILILRMMQKADDGLSAISNLMITSFATAVFLAGAIVMSGESFAIPDARSGFALGGYALFSQVFGWILITTALPSLRASLSGLLLLFQPLLAFVWDILFFGRPTSLAGYLGVAVTIGAIYLGSVGMAQNTETELIEEGIVSEQ